jgi:hypothetical protein
MLWTVQGNPNPFGLGLLHRLDADGSLDYTLSNARFHAQARLAGTPDSPVVSFPPDSSFADVALLSQATTTFHYAPGNLLFPTVIEGLNFSYTPGLRGIVYTARLASFEEGASLEAIPAWPKATVPLDGHYEPYFPGDHSTFFNGAFSAADAVENLSQKEASVRQALQGGGCVRSILLAPSYGSSTNPIAGLPAQSLERFDPVDVMVDGGDGASLHHWEIVRKTEASTVPYWDTPKDLGPYKPLRQLDCQTLLSAPRLRVDAPTFWSTASKLPIHSMGWTLQYFDFNTIRYGFDPLAGPGGAIAYYGYWTFPPEQSGGGMPMYAGMYPTTGSWAEMMVRAADVDALDAYHAS